MGEYLKTNFRIAGRTGHGDKGIQNPKIAHFKGKKPKIN